MIVRVQFDEKDDLTVLFGNTKVNHWHKYFREYVQKFGDRLPKSAFNVTASETKWTNTIRLHENIFFAQTHRRCTTYLNKWLCEADFVREYKGNYYEDIRYYYIPSIADKVNEILARPKPPGA